MQNAWASRRLVFVVLIFSLIFANISFAQNTPPLGHVVVVAMENHSYGDVVGSSAMPYYNSLINQYGLAQNFIANVHGSFPDYAMLTTGELITQAGWGLPGDFPISIDNLVRQLAAAGKTWKVYAESIPGAGYTGGDSYPYVKRHNPFAYMSDVLNSPSQAGHIVPFSQFASDLAANTLPNFSFVVPNAQNDAEDCPTGGTGCTDAAKLSNADQWLQANIAPLLSNPAFQQDGLLVIWWDEGNSSDTNAGGKVAITLVGPTIKTGYRSTTIYHHEHLLRTIAEGLGLGFPGASVYVQSMGEFFGARTATGSSIGGQVTDASTGAALSGTTISYSGGSATSDVGGNYTLTNVAPGTYSVTASNAGYSTQSSSVTVTSGATSTQNFQLTASASNTPGGIKGTVTNVSNPTETIPGTTISYSGGSVVTDSNGNYSFSSVVPGAYNVTATHAGWFVQTKSATVASGGTTTVNFALATGGIVAGTVTNSSGAAISGAAVKITGGSITTTVNTTTNASGGYNSDWVPVGTYTVTITASGFTTQSQTVNVTTGTTTTLNFTMN